MSTRRRPLSCQRAGLCESKWPLVSIRAIPTIQTQRATQRTTVSIRAIPTLKATQRTASIPTTQPETHPT